jgi:hypothetical protein
LFGFCQSFLTWQSTREYFFFGFEITETKFAIPSAVSELFVLYRFDNSYLVALALGAFH